MLHFEIYIIIDKEIIISKLFYHSIFQLKMKRYFEVFSKYLLIFHDNLTIF